MEFMLVDIRVVTLIFNRYYWGFKINEDNVLKVVVDSTERPDIPPHGYVVDYLTYGGIYREVSLRIVEPIFINNLYARAYDCLKEEKD